MDTPSVITQKTLFDELQNVKSLLSEIKTVSTYVLTGHLLVEDIIRDIHTDRSIVMSWIDQGLLKAKKIPGVTKGGWRIAIPDYMEFLTHIEYDSNTEEYNYTADPEPTSMTQLVTELRDKYLAEFEENNHAH